MLAEVELDSSDYLDRTAIHLAPINPRRVGEMTALRFRCAQRFGYGASAGMVQTCLERCDRDGIHGGVQIRRVPLRLQAGRDAGTGLADRRRNGLSERRRAQAPRSRAPKRSPAAVTIAPRRALASSSVSVRSADWKESASATDLLPAGTCSPR